jgi:hypothetical protein
VVRQRWVSTPERKKGLNKSEVAVVRCGTYGEPTVYAAVKRGLDMLGRLQRFIKSQTRHPVEAVRSTFSITGLTR